MTTATALSSQESDPQSLGGLAARLHRDHRNVALASLGVTYLLVAASVALVAWQPAPWAWALAFLINGFMGYRLVLACHEAVHRAFLYPLWLNELAGLVSGALVGMNFHRYRFQHLAHHRAPRIAEDPDAYIYRPILQARPGWPRFSAYALGMVSEIFEKFRQKGFGGDSDPRARRHSLVMVGLNGLFFAALWLLFGRWWAYPVLWLLPVLTVSLFVNRTRVFVEHAFCYADRTWERAELEAQPVKTIDLLSNPLERFFMAGFCFHYHNAHHRLPTIPHYNLRPLALHLAAHEPGYHPLVQGSYLRNLIRMLRSA